MVSYFCGASHIASIKKNDGVCPIAVGEVLRRLVSKCLMAVVLPQAIDLLSLLQLGVGVPCGSESIIHVVNLHLSGNASSSVKPILLIDFSNAFNSIDRSFMFSSIFQRLPSWFESCYGSAPFLYYRNRSLASCSGVQQGDPLRPLGFALALQPVIEHLASSVSSSA